MPTSVFCRHGHEWTPANTYIDPAGSRRCRACCREGMRAYRERIRAPLAPRHGWLQRALLRALHQHPSGLTVDGLCAATGYRASRESVRSTLWRLRHAHGLLIEATYTPSFLPRIPRALYALRVEGAA